MFCISNPSVDACAVCQKKTQSRATAPPTPIWILRLPAAGPHHPRRHPRAPAYLLSAAPSSPHHGLPPLRRTRFADSEAQAAALQARAGRLQRTPPTTIGLLNTLLAAMGHDWEEEDAREAGQRHNQRVLDPAEAEEPARSRDRGLLVVLLRETTEGRGGMGLTPENGDNPAATGRIQMEEGQGGARGRPSRFGGAGSRVRGGAMVAR